MGVAHLRGIDYFCSGFKVYIQELRCAQAPVEILR